MDGKTRWQMLGFLAAVYMVFLLVLVVGYPLAKQYMAPVLDWIFPMNDSSLLKQVLVMTGMYWGGVGVYMLMLQSSAKSGK